MRHSNPRVSIGIPVFNGEMFLPATLDSLLCQTFSNFEIVISDNGSTDRTEQICRFYASTDGRIRYYRSETNHGAAWNYNRVFRLARGEYFKWAAADDLCLPEFLASCVAALDAESEAVLACTDVAEIDADGTPREYRQVPRDVQSPSASARFWQQVSSSHFCEHVFGVIRSSVLCQTDLIGSYTDSDRVLLAHLALLGPFTVVPQPLLLNRAHPHRSTRYYVGYRDRTLWFDPTAAHRKSFPFWREFVEFWSIVRRSPVPWNIQLECYWTMLGWLYRHKVYLFHDDLSYYPRQWLTRHFPWTKAIWAKLKRLYTRTESLNPTHG